MPHVGDQSEPAATLGVEHPRDVRVQADARHVDKHPAGDLAKVDHPVAATQHDPKRLAPGQRDAEGTGEPAARPRGKHRQGHRQSTEGRRHFVDRPVAAPGGDDVRACGDGLGRQVTPVAGSLGDQ